MTEPTRQQTLQQKRAAHAMARINEVAQKKDDLKKKYGSLVRGLPSLVQSDGLGQALAFLKAKAKGKSDNEHSMAYDHIQKWIQQELPEELRIDDDLLESLIKKNSSHYRQVTAEVLSYLGWLKRFAEAQGWQDEER